MDLFACIRLPPPPPPPPQSPLFALLPVEVRLLIYEFVFTPAPPCPEQWALPKSSATLEPLLTCHGLYEEARVLAFACATHNLNWARPSHCLRRLRALDAVLHRHIRHVALTSTPSGLFETLLPLRQHLDHNVTPHLSLDSLTIVLDVPEVSGGWHRNHRLQEQNMVFCSIWYFKNIKKVVLLNVLHREGLKNHPGMHGEWTCINEEKSIQAAVMQPTFDSGLVDAIRWRFELTSFYDYAWKPWHV